MKTDLIKQENPQPDHLSFTKYDLLNYIFGFLFIYFAFLTNNLQIRIFYLGLGISALLCLFSTRSNVLFMYCFNFIGMLLFLSGVLNGTNIFPTTINYTGVVCIAGGYLFFLGAMIREQSISPATKILVLCGGCAIGAGIMLLGQPLESSILLIFFFSAITIGPGSFFAYITSKITHPGLFLE